MKNKILIAMLIVNLAGCAATVHTPASQTSAISLPTTASKRVVLNISGSTVATSSSDWRRLNAEWRKAMGLASQKAGMTLQFQDAAVKNDEPGTLVTIYIDDFRFVSPGARFAFGVMTGNAFVDATARFSDLQNGASFGERKYNTKSSAWDGIFAAVTDKQVQAMSDQIIAVVAQR